MFLLVKITCVFVSECEAENSLKNYLENPVRVWRTLVVRRSFGAPEFPKDSRDTRDSRNDPLFLRDSNNRE